MLRSLPSKICLVDSPRGIGWYVVFGASRTTPNVAPAVGKTNPLNHYPFRGKHAFGSGWPFRLLLPMELLSGADIGNARTTIARLLSMLLST